MTRSASEFSLRTTAADPEERYAFELAGTPELVTNAVRHADAGPDRLVRLELRQRRGAVRVAVCDEGPGFAPEATCLRPDETGGWGLLLVDRIADRWAVTRTATSTCVWFEIRYEE